jgi:putative phage-type endonuclease
MYSKGSRGAAKRLKQHNREGANKMTAIKLVSTKDMPREDWLKHRNAGIGGSDISAILGFNSYKNAVTVFLEKTDQIDSVEENFKMKMGNILEPIVADLFAEEHPELKVKKNNFLLQHPKVPIMLANIDREIICPIRGKGILEIKTTGAFNQKSWTGNTVPDMYMFQVQHYLAVTGYKFAYMAVLIGGNEAYKSYYIDRDEGIISYIEEEAQKFWQCVESNTPPELDGSEASREALGILYPSEESVLEEINLSIHSGAVLEELREIKRQEVALEERRRLLQAQVIQELGNHQIGRVGHYYVTWKPQQRQTVDSKALKAKYPEIHAEVLKISESRPFNLSYKENQ